MSDTTNSGADPWGLPENSEPAEEVTEPAPPPVEPLERTDAEEPARAPDVDVESFPSPEPPAEPAAAEAPEESPPAPPQPESRGPLSQVLAASGLFGSKPVPAAEPDEPAEEPEAPVEPAIDVAALETPETSEAPDLTAPTSGGQVGIGATDADLPNEPPPWMVADPQEVTDEGLTTEAEDALDEVAAAFADVSFTEEPVAAVDSADPEEMESLVAELTDISSAEPAVEPEPESDITIDPDDTPTVYKELEQLEETLDEVTGPEETTDVTAPPDLEAFEVPDHLDATVEATDDVTEFTAEDDETASDLSDLAAEVEEAAVSGATEWDIFEASDPDEPVFGVAFGKEPEPEVRPEPEAEVEPPAVETEEESAVVEEESPYEPEIDPEFAALASFAELADEAGSEVAEEDQVAEVESVEIETVFAEETPAEPREALGEPDAALSAFETAETADEPADSPVEWGSRWQESAQGWVEDENGQSSWRPIVTASPILSDWQVDTYLGVVDSDAVLGDGPVLDELPRARAEARKALVDEAMARGAHAILGVSTTLATVGAISVLSASGTAVTLKAQD